MKPAAQYLMSAAGQPKSATQSPGRVNENLGMTSERTRMAMVERLRQQGIEDEEVLRALGVVPRHQFVDEGLASRAYQDMALPIGFGQTISQPYIVARMLALARQSGPLTRVLEIGTGCGYQAAVLARLAQEIYSIERIKALHELARVRLRPHRISNLRLVHGDGMLGLPQVAPFNAIVIAAAGVEIPPSLLLQLEVGGRLVAPVGKNQQFLQCVMRTDVAQWQRMELEEVQFVPLQSGVV